MQTAHYTTNHRFITADARNFGHLPEESVDLVVTSPPYPMIRMWDEVFARLSPDAGEALRQEDAFSAFILMHEELDKVWRECYRVCRDGSFVCINIGDATRSVGNNFQLFTNHSRVIASCIETGFDTLPLILWRKQTNAPNKFMGSGMLPAGAYVTLEHEYILIFRKGGKRQFATAAEKKKRMESALFWEERNTWFSDVWDFKGARQHLDSDTLRKRSAAFPLELARRLIRMYSLYGDTVLDPFAGTGTTVIASALCGRNSIGIDIDSGFGPLVEEQFDRLPTDADTLQTDRINAHLAFTKKRAAENKACSHTNIPHGFPVMTKQETELLLRNVSAVTGNDDHTFQVAYTPEGTISEPAPGGQGAAARRKQRSPQLSLDL
jgi:modification methylase